MENSINFLFFFETVRNLPQSTNFRNSQKFPRTMSACPRLFPCLLDPRRGPTERDKAKTGKENENGHLLGKIENCKKMRLGLRNEGAMQY